ncbi:MAG: hypothetical protein JW730_06925 [Anaerolineales bacterium]|nr:hypothetical protein [Anaerolineales bacterium]
MRNYTAYAVTRLDGALLHSSICAGLMTTGLTKSPIVHFKVLAGVQPHPVWALDDLAVEIFSYCQAAKQAGVSDTHLQVSVTGSLVSVENFSNIIAGYIEWHIPSSQLRTEAERVLSKMRRNGKTSWPVESLSLPVQSR